MLRASCARPTNPPTITSALPSDSQRLDRPVDERLCALITCEDVAAGEPSDQHCQVRVRRVVLQQFVCVLHQREALVESALPAHDEGEPARQTRSCVRLACALIEADRLDEQKLASLKVGRRLRCARRVLEQLGALQYVICERGRLCQIALSFARRGERLRSQGGTDEGIARPCLQLGVAVGCRLVCVHKMRRDDLGNLVGVGERMLEVRRGREVAHAPVALRQRLVRDVADEVLQEPVLAVFGRTRVGLLREDLLRASAASSGSTSSRGARTPRRRPRA